MKTLNIIALILFSLIILVTIISKHITGLDIKWFLNSCIIPCMVTFGVTYALCYTIRYIVHVEFLRLFTTCFISVVTTAVLAYYYVFDKKEQSVVKPYINTILRIFK